MQIRIVLLLLLLGLFSLQGSSSYSDSQLTTTPLQTTKTIDPDAPVILDADLIRVGISDTAMDAQEYPNATISATGPYRITEKTSGRLVLNATANENIRITRLQDRYTLLAKGHVYRGNGTLTVTPNKGGLLKVPSVLRKGHVPAYRGIFEITAGFSSPKKLSIVNVLPMQDYLKAVVPNELPYTYGYEAIKAQAVAARNYAIRPREKPWPQFDICDSQYCQAYYGASTEQAQTTHALEQTQGLIALYQGDPILALYSSSHGGHSENYENAFSDVKTNQFPGTPLPYLVGKADEPTAENADLSQDAAAAAFYSDTHAPSYDELSRQYRWRKVWTRAELEATLNKTLPDAFHDTFTAPFVLPAVAPKTKIGQLKDLKITQRGVSGKAMRVVITTSNGTWTVNKEFVIRKVLAYHGKRLPSANFVLILQRDKAGKLVSVTAIGGGFGHGVGMSQLGASYMDKHLHQFYIAILKHYYTGIAIGTIPIVAHADQGMHTDFYVSTAQGILKLQAPRDSTTPVHLAINGQTLNVSPDTSGNAAVDVAAFLQPDQLNTLTLYPYNSATGSAKAWIELY